MASGGPGEETGTILAHVALISGTGTSVVDIKAKMSAESPDGPLVAVSHQLIGPGWALPRGLIIVTATGWLEASFRGLAVTTEGHSAAAAAH